MEDTSSGLRIEQGRKHWAGVSVTCKTAGKRDRSPCYGSPRGRRPRWGAAAAQVPV